MTIADIIVTIDATPPVSITFDGGTQPTIVVEEQPAVVVALPGTQGLPGPIGPAGGQLNAEAGGTLNGHRAVAVASDGRLQHASADNPDHALAVLGIIEQAVVIGETVPVRSNDVIEFSGWAWAPGPVLLGLDGQLTQTLPPSAVFEQTIGRGNGTRLLVDLQPPIDL